MLRADRVMDADQPRLEVREDEMDDGQEILGHFRIATFGNGIVVVAALAPARQTLLMSANTSPGRYLRQPDRQGSMHIEQRRP
jgi:hypothetical protein